MGSAPIRTSFSSPSAPARQPQMPAGVLDIHRELFLSWRIVADLVEPDRGTAAPAGRVDDEIGGEDLATARGRQHAGTGDPVPGRRGDQARHVATIPDRDVAQGADPVADLAFQVRPALRVRWLAGFTLLAQQVAPKDETERPRSTHHRDTIRRQVGEQPREQFVEDLRPARQQPMGVPSLGHPLTVQPGLRQRVPFDDRHPPVRISQHTGGEQAAHTGTQHQRMITNLPHFRPPPWGIAARPGGALLATATRVATSPAQRYKGRGRRCAADTQTARRDLSAVVADCFPGGIVADESMLYRSPATSPCSTGSRREAPWSRRSSRPIPSSPTLTGTCCSAERGQMLAIVAEQSLHRPVPLPSRARSGRECTPSGAEAVVLRQVSGTAACRFALLASSHGLAPR